MCDHHHSIPLQSALVEHTELTIYFKVTIWIKKAEGKPLIVNKQNQHTNTNDEQRSVERIYIMGMTSQRCKLLLKVMHCSQTNYIIYLC